MPRSSRGLSGAPLSGLRLPADAHCRPAQVRHSGARQADGAARRRRGVSEARDGCGSLVFEKTRAGKTEELSRSFEAREAILFSCERGPDTFMDCITPRPRSWMLA